MSGETLVRHCSPTLAGLKTANLFTCAYATKADMQADIRTLNRRLCSKGLRVMPLQYRNGRALIYIYRPALLQKDFDRRECRALLQSEGYCTGSCGKCLAQLRERLQHQEDFPHEIGLFLGYPPEDVRGFIEHRAGCKLVGAWKVYGDAAKAARIFEQYKKCTATYLRKFAQGSSVECLAVSV